MTADKRVAMDSTAMGTLYIVGIGPGLPEHLTARAREVIQRGDCLIVADLYRKFLAVDGIIPAADGQTVTRADGQTQDILESQMDQQAELATEAFQRVRNGDDVVHVSGGDPNVYGKSDLLFRLARHHAATDIPIEVVPGVTAGLGGAASLGAPLSDDFCTVSLSSRRDWEVIATRLQGAVDGGFVILLYNCFRRYEQAVSFLTAHRDPTTPAGIFRDIGRQDRGYSGEQRVITTLADIPDHPDLIEAPGSSILIGTEATDIWNTNHGQFLVTPRDDRPLTQAVPDLQGAGEGETSESKD